MHYLVYFALQAIIAQIQACSLKFILLVFYNEYSYISSMIFEWFPRGALNWVSMIAERLKSLGQLCA